MADTGLGPVIDALKRAVEDRISEDDYWEAIDKAVAEQGDNPVVELVYDYSVPYWGLWHERNIFLFKVRPKPEFVQEQRNILAVIARGLEESWGVNKIKEAIRNV